MDFVFNWGHCIHFLEILDVPLSWKYCLLMWAKAEFAFILELCWFVSQPSSNTLHFDQVWCNHKIIEYLSWEGIQKDRCYRSLNNLNIDLIIYFFIRANIKICKLLGKHWVLPEFRCVVLHFLIFYGYLYSLVGSCGADLGISVYFLWLWCWDETISVEMRWLFRRISISVYIHWYVLTCFGP